MDTSALLKLYLDESSPRHIRDLISAATVECAFYGVGRTAAFMLAAFDDELCRAVGALGIPVMA